MGKSGCERDTIVLVERFQDNEEETICDDIASISRSLRHAFSKLRCAWEQPLTLGGHIILENLKARARSEQEDLHEIGN